MGEGVINAPAFDAGLYVSDGIYISLYNKYKRLFSYGQRRHEKYSKACGAQRPMHMPEILNIEFHRSLKSPPTQAGMSPPIPSKDIASDLGSQKFVTDNKSDEYENLGDGFVIDGGGCDIRLENADILILNLTWHTLYHMNRVS